MFIGHFGLALGAKELAQQPSLGTCFLAAQFLDLLWPVLLLAGIEHVEIDPGNTAFTPLHFVFYPYSHSLFMALLWSLLFGAVYFWFRRNVKASVVLGVLVFSHWFLDFLTHSPDLPLTPWSETRVGLGLWNHRLSTLILESLIFSLGFYLYILKTNARNKTGKIALGAFFIFMILVYLANAFGPPPESVQLIAIVGFTQWILVAWGYWIDKNRTVIPAG
jgi:hypothetical protein